MLVAMVIRDVALVFMVPLLVMLVVVVPCMFVVMVLVLRVVVILILIFFILVVIILLILVMGLIIIIIIFSGTLSKVSNPESKTTAWEDRQRKKILRKRKTKRARSSLERIHFELVDNGLEEVLVLIVEPIADNSGE
jgi:predicted membrane protein